MDRNQLENLSLVRCGDSFVVSMNVDPAIRQIVFRKP
jgi:hypothetical protein